MNSGRYSFVREATRHRVRVRSFVGRCRARLYRARRIHIAERFARCRWWRERARRVDRSTRARHGAQEALWAPEMGAMYAFQQLLIDEGYTCFVRKRRGDDVAAACGQLAFLGAKPRVRADRS
jgi:hypothetical protein